MAWTDKVYIYYNPTPIVERGERGIIWSIHFAKVIDDENWWDWDAFVLLKRDDGVSTCVEAYWAEDVPIPGKGIYKGHVAKMPCKASNIPVPPAAQMVDWGQFFDKLLHP